MISGGRESATTNETRERGVVYRANMMWLAACLGALAVASRPLGTTPRARTAVPVMCATTSTTQSAALKSELLAAIDAGEAPERVRTLCDALSATQAGVDVDVPRLLRGDWRTLFSTLKLSTAKTVPLKLLSFGVLPAKKVMIGTWFNRVTEERYTLMPEVMAAEDTPTAGLALTGWCNFDEAPRRCSVQFESVGLVPATGEYTERDHRSEAAIRELLAGKDIDVNAPQRPASVFRWFNAHKTYIDITYIDEDIRVHTGKSGEVYVLERMPADQGIPFCLPRE